MRDFQAWRLAVAIGILAALSSCGSAGNVPVHPVDAGATPEDVGATPDDSAAPPDAPPDGVVTSTIARVVAPDYLNLRGGPATVDAVLLAIPCGGAVTVLVPPSGPWWNVDYLGTAGWASADGLVYESAFDPASCPGPEALSAQPPAALVDVLDVPPYVEESCAPTTFASWPFAASACTYGGGLAVTVADPPPDRVARWVHDSAQVIPALWSLRVRDPAHFAAGLAVIAQNVLNQSSRIFPLAGQVQEDVVYRFDRGVTATCSTGCYCRINSTLRQTWCAYAATVLQIETEAACLARYSTTTFTDAWAEHCLDNHRAAWTSDINHHFRARAFEANLQLAAAFPNPDTADGASVVTALGAEFP
jgi:hypothetical protein